MMKRIWAWIVLSLMLAAGTVLPGCGEGGGASSIRQMVMPEEKAFSFRNGVTWGMSAEQISATEDIAMETRNATDWSVRFSASPVQVSRFSADLVYMLFQDQLKMITYEFQEDCSPLNYQYLTGALCSVYGEGTEASAVTIRECMDRVFKNYYRQELIREAWQWTAGDGTNIFLYYYTEETYAILYVSPVLSIGGGQYDVNGL